MNFNTYMPVEVISGRDCLIKNSSLLKALGKRCLIVTGGTSAKKSGALDDMTSALKKEGIEYDIFSEITENPYTEDCRRAGEMAREIGADFIVGIGGGSPLDASKAVAIFASNKELSHSDIYKMDFKNLPLPLVLVGTTAGTGSEVTGVSVLTNSDNNMKKSISGKLCYSVISFCDYKYTLSVPYGVTVSTMLDAFAHATESYFAKNANELSDIYAEKAFELLSKAFEYFYNNKTLPSEEMRESLYAASIFAGLCLNMTGTCFPHTMGYILTEDYNIPHGRACAAFTNEFLKYAKESLPEKFNKMLSLMNMTGERLCDIISTLADVKINMSDEEFSKYINRWADPFKNFTKTPGSFDTKAALELLKRI